MEIWLIFNKYWIINDGNLFQLPRQLGIYSQELKNSSLSLFLSVSLAKVANEMSPVMISLGADIVFKSQFAEASNQFIMALLISILC